jgi:hypothetical protein
LELDRDLDQLLLLFEHCFHKPADPATWLWKYQPPWIDQPWAWVGTQGDRIVGHIGAVPLRGRVNGEDALFFQLGDIMADPDIRSVNVYLELDPTKVLAEIAQEHPYSVVYGFTGSKLAAWYNWMASVGRKTWIEAAHDRILRVPQSVGALPEGGDLEVREWGWDASEIDDLWERQKDLIGAGLVRDRLWLEWRYARHPSIKYALYGVFSGNEAVGWLVTGAEDCSQPREEVRIHDFLVPAELRLPALRRAASVLRARSLVLWLPNHCVPIGLQNRKTGWQVMHHSLSPKISRHFFEQNLFYTLGEADEWWW